MNCEKCGGPIKAGRRFCSNQCRRVDPVALLWQRTEKTNGCWIWKGPTKVGYGVIEVSWRKPNRIMVHRLSYEIHHGPIPEGMVVCHKCDNPPCVNPDHLFVGTRHDNAVDMVQKNRVARGTRTGNAVLTDELVRKIRVLRANGNGPKAIQLALGLSRGSVQSVIYGGRWGHVAVGR